MGRLLLALSLALALGGCSSVRVAAVPTGSLRLPPRAGPVQIYAAAPLPVGAVELGVVEVRAAGDEATVDQMLPVFVQRVAGLGGNAAVVESVRGRIDVVTRPIWETYYYACGFRMTCTGSRMSAMTDEVLVVVMRGRAVHVGDGS